MPTNVEIAAPVHRHAGIPASRRQHAATSKGYDIVINMAGGPPLRDESFVLRPSRSAYRRRVVPAAAGMTPLVVLGFIRVVIELESRPARLAVGLLGLLFLLLVIAIVVSVPRTARLAVSSGRIELRGWFLRTRSFATQDVTTIVKARTSRTQVLLLDDRGRRLLALNAPLWPRADIDHLIGAIGAPIDLINTTAPKQLRTHYPQAVPWAYAHPLKAGLLFNLAWIVLFIIIAVLVEL